MYSKLTTSTESDALTFFPAHVPSTPGAGTPGQGFGGGTSIGNACGGGGGAGGAGDMYILVI